MTRDNAQSDEQMEKGNQWGNRLTRVWYVDLPRKILEGQSQFPFRLLPTWAIALAMSQVPEPPSAAVLQLLLLSILLNQSTFHRLL